MAILMSLLLLIPTNYDGSLWDEPVQASPVAVRETQHPENVEASNWWSVPEWARCPEYWHVAQAAGWPLEQMPTVDYVMHRESHCNPNAYNRSGATGLMQLLGWTCNPNGCRDPYSNLLRARQLWEQSGWHPWCLRGDRVTGSC